MEMSNFCIAKFAKKKKKKLFFGNPSWIEIKVLKVKHMFYLNIYCISQFIILNVKLVKYGLTSGLALIINSSKQLESSFVNSIM